MCPVIQLTCKEFKTLLDMLERYLEEHEHDIADFYPYWEEEVELAERLKEIYREVCEIEDEEEEEDN